jgi:DNA repair exonuclease SbcCD ATPase subunit
LNKRLVEENRHLVEAVNREHPESFGDQLVSALEEKAAEDDKVKEQLRDALKKSEEKCAHLIEDLEAEKEARRRGAEKFKMQIESASREVESLVEDLDHKLASKEEEIKVLKERLGQDGREADRVKDAEERAEKAREAREVAERKAVGMERDLERCKSDLDRRAREVSALERKSEELASALRDEKATTTALSNQLQDSSSRLSEMESRALSAESGLEELASELSSKQASLVSANVRISTLEAELKRNETDIEERQKLEAALDECERKLVTDDEDIRSLRKKTEALEEEVQSARRQTHRQPHPSELESDTSSMDTAPEEMMRVEEHERIITDLEAQLDEAHRDIGRLEHQLAGSPASKALAQAKDVRIELLEKERQELMERVDALRGALGAGDADGTLKPSTPGAGAASSTPARPLHKAVLSLRTPKTPGAPLKDVSDFRSDFFFCLLIRAIGRQLAILASS